MKRKKSEKPKQAKEKEQGAPEAAKPQDTKQELQSLRQQLADLQKEKDELFAKLQRLSADYANFQKRVPKQIADTITYEKEAIIKTLLPALDNFEHTLKNAHSAEQTDVFVKGIQIIYDQMLDILKAHNVEQIKALEEKFDPAFHQAMMRQHELDKAEDVVLEVLQTGYKLNGRVIRPSKVVVNKPPVQQTVPQQVNQSETSLDRQQSKPEKEQTTDECEKTGME